MAHLKPCLVIPVCGLGESAGHKDRSVVYKRDRFDKQGVSYGRHVKSVCAVCLHDQQLIDLMAGYDGTEDDFNRQHRYHNTIVNCHDVLRLGGDMRVARHAFCSVDCRVEPLSSASSSVLILSLYGSAAVPKRICIVFDEATVRKQRFKASPKGGGFEVRR